MFARRLRQRFISKNRHAWIPVVFLALLLTGCNLPSSSEKAALETPLMQMLRYIPDTADYRQWVSFGDAALWHAAWDIPRVSSMDEVMDDLDPKTEKPYWMNVLPRQAVPPVSLRIEMMFTEDQTALFGFSFFNLDRYLEAGSPPDAITIAEFSFEGQQIAAALETLGYASEPLGDGSLYRIRDDYEVDLQSEYRTNQMANLNRIVLLGNRLLIGNASPVVQSALEAFAGERRSLAENESFRAVALALADPALEDFGDLVGIMFTNWGQLDGRGNLKPEQSAKLTESLLSEWAQPLPAYELAAFATLQNGQTTYLLLALVFPQGVDAQSAADVVAGRMETYTSLSLQQPLDDRWELEKAAGVEVNGLPVALVVMRAIPREPQEITPGSYGVGVWSWYQLVVRRDVMFLLPEE